jgi:hypothetical protein
MFGFLRRRRRRSTSLQRPLRRTDGVITTETEDEVLVYDELRHHIHHLNPTTSLVWRLCDGTRTIDRIAQEGGIELDFVTLALRELTQVHLLEGDTSAWMGEPQSRRTFLRNASMASIPAIVSVTAPKAAAAQSGGGCYKPPELGTTSCYEDCHCPPLFFCAGGDPGIPQPGSCEI